MRRKRIQNLQALRGIAVFLVVFFHIAVIEEKYGSYDAILANYLAIGAASVDLFFLISGFVMVTVSRNAFQNPRGIISFIYHRVTRIYPLYWLYATITLCVYLFLSQMVNTPDRLENHNLLASFLLLPQSDLPLVVVAWTLTLEVYFYFMFALFLFAPEKHLVKLLLLWGFLTFVGDLMLRHGLLESTPGMQLITHNQTSEFIAGCLIARLIYGGVTSYGATALFLGVTLLLGGLAAYDPVTYTDLPIGWLRIALFGIPCALIMYGAITAEIRRGWVFSKIFILTGDASYSIYLSHVLVIATIGRVWYMLAGGGEIDNVTIISLMITAVLVFGFASYFILEKPLLLWNRRVEHYVTDFISSRLFRIKAA
jgi:exopolysaccharide production protein ExoZ